MYFGFDFSESATALLKQAARGREKEAIAKFNAGDVTVSVSEVKPFVETLLAFKAADLAYAVASKMHADNPALVEAAFLHALTNVYTKREDAGISIATEAIQKHGQQAGLFMVVGLAMLSVGSLQNAGSMFQQTLQRNGPVIALAYMGEVLRLMGRPKDAIACFEQCLGAGCIDAEAYYLAGNALYDDGKIDKAILHYEKAIEVKPWYIDAHDALNKTLWEHRRADGFMKSFETAAKAHPDLLELNLRQAHFFIMAGQLEAAGSILELSLQAFGPNPRILAELAGVREQLDQEFDPLPLYAQAYEMDTTDLGLLKSYGRALIGSGDYKKATEVMADARQIDGLDQECIAYLAAANHHVKPAEAARINNFEDFVQVFDLAPPQGYASIGSFNSSLLQALHPLHRSDIAPIDQTLVRGTQTHGNLFSSDRREISQLQTRLREAISEYIQKLSSTGPGEFRDRISQNFDFSGAWSVQLSDGGYHHDHVHSAGWISSVYYVEVPDNLDRDSHEGWLKFGDTVFDPQNPGPRRFVEPKPGRLVLFPSFMVHGTVPISEGKRRTTVAFDVVPI